MAKSGERRMLFDIRGRRRHVVRVVYAILALLMGASLFLVVGPFSIGNLINTGSTTSAVAVSQEQAERLEERLRREPENPDLLASLTRARIAAGQALSEPGAQTGVVLLPPEGRREIERAGVAWKRYLKQSQSANPLVAQLMANAYFLLAETAPAFGEIAGNVAEAAATQKLAVEGRSTLNALTTLAIYEYYAGNFGIGDAAAKKAEAIAPKSQLKEVKKQMKEFRQRGKSFQVRKQEVAKTEGKEGKESLKNPFGGLDSGTSPLGQ